MFTIQSKTRKAGRFVSNTHVDTVIRNYKQERWVNNSKHIGKEDSLSVWYSVAEIEEFLEKAKMYGADGVKFYFAAYDKNFEEQPLYAGRQTLVMVATQAKEGPTGTVDKDLYISSGSGSSILAYNVGKLCPPYCGKPSAGEDIGIAIVDRGEEGLSVI